MDLTAHTGDNHWFAPPAGFVELGPASSGLIIPTRFLETYQAVELDLSSASDTLEKLRYVGSTHESHSRSSLSDFQTAILAMENGLEDIDRRGLPN